MIHARLTGLWHHPDFLKLWCGQTVSIFGTLIGRFALSLTAILVLNASPFEIALLRIAELAPVLLTGLFAGIWVDRLRRRHVMIVADVGRALALVTIPIAASLGLLRFWQLCVVATLVSVLGLFFDVAYQSYLPSLVRRDHLLEGNSKLQASSSIAEVSSFGLAGTLVQLLTAPIVILVDAASFLFSATLLVLIRSPEPKPTKPDERPGVRQELIEGLRLVTGNRVLRACVGAEGTQSFFGNGMLGTLVMLFLVQDLHLEPVAMGLIFSLGGISAFLGAVAAEPLIERWGVGAGLVRAYLISAIAMLFIPLAGGPTWLILTFLALQQLLGDGAATVYDIGRSSLLQTMTPDRLLGRMNASLRTVGWMGMLAGALTAGALGELIGLRATLLIASLGSAIAVLWLVRSPLRGMRESPTAEAEATPTVA